MKEKFPITKFENKMEGVTFSLEVGNWKSTRSNFVYEKKEK